MHRTLAIGDVHGCREELSDLLKVVSYRPGDDRLVFVGDLVDRGPDPAGVVRVVRQLARDGDVRAVVGNHEEKLLRWFRRCAEEAAGGKKNMMSRPDPTRLAEWESITPEERAWLASLPVVDHVTEGWAAVHAGFEGVPMAAQKPDKMVRVRWLKPDGKMAPYIKGSLKQPPGSVHWSERWTGPHSVVYGHAVHSLTDVRCDRPAPGIEVWGIDTGCVFGGRLTALCLETRETFQVDARAQYAELRSDDE
jgi:bis(5'-nucleosyl)-tetraphosphatase (symmetrical)